MYFYFMQSTDRKKYYVLFMKCYKKSEYKTHANVPVVSVLIHYLLLFRVFRL